MGYGMKWEEEEKERERRERERQQSRKMCQWERKKDMMEGDKILWEREERNRKILWKKTKGEMREREREWLHRIDK